MRDRCADQYYMNRCEPHRRVEALDQFCEEKEACMNTPMQAGVKAISAATGLLAQVINSFALRLELPAFILLILGAGAYFNRPAAI